MPNRRTKLPQDARAALARIPAVSALLDHPALAPRIAELGRRLVTELLREHLQELREQALAGTLDQRALERESTAEASAAAVQRAAAALTAPRPRRVINATGVVVHTNLGRATLGARAAERVAAAARGYLELEYDLEAGRRGDRLAGLEPLMARLFPGQGFTVLNNNAAAVLLCLHALGRGKDVLVSRGELVEIGGSFRIPDIMSASGARLREVGTTNRTRIADYESALSADTGLVLKVHPSNFSIVGFTEATSVAELAELARSTGVPLVVDWGSGDLVDLAPLGLYDELPVSRLLADGADLVTFSGDKLLGGPQAGFVVGREELVSRVRADPLSRACRLDRLRLGALHETLVAYLTGRAFEDVPTLRMLAAEVSELELRARALVAEIVRQGGAAERVALVDGVSRSGGGSSPAGERATRLLAVSGPSGDAGAIERRLRSAEPPIIGRMQEGRLLLDLRTVLPEEEATLARSVAQALRAESDERSG